MEKLHKIYSMIELNYVLEIFLLIRNARPPSWEAFGGIFLEVLISLSQAARWREVCAYCFVHLLSLKDFHVKMRKQIMGTSSEWKKPGECFW